MIKRTRPVLVTGATGFLGGNFTRRLAGRGGRVHIFVRHGSDFWRIKDIKSRLTIHRVDLTNEQAVAREVAKIQPARIFHFAAHGLYLKQSEIENMVATNIHGTVNLLSAARALKNFEMFINAGDSFEYGLKSKPIREDDLLEPINAYGVSKAAQSLWALYFSQFYKLPVIVLRPSLTYGAYEESRRLVPTAILAHLRGKELRLSSPESRKDFIYMEDVLDAFELAGNSLHLAGRIFNIATGKEQSVRDVVTAVRRLTHAKIPFAWNTLERRSWDSARALYDTTASSRDLGWKPRHSLSAGLDATITWFREYRQLYEKN